jgi:hypothetical protein
MWVLILFMLAGNGGASAVVDFKTEDACNKAGEKGVEMMARRWSYGKGSFLCLKKE